MRVYEATMGAPLLFRAENDDQARLILNHIAEHIMDAPLPHGAVWTAQEGTTLAESLGRDSVRPVAIDRAERYAPVDPAAAGACPVCADHARRQNYPRASEDARDSEETTR